MATAVPVVENFIRSINLRPKTNPAEKVSLSSYDWKIFALFPARRRLSDLSDSRLSRQLHRLRSLGLIKRVTRSYRYYLTRLGRAAIAAACSLTQFQIIPALAHAR